MSDTEELEQRLQDLIDIVSNANQKAMDGNPVDLGNLDEKVSALHNDIQEAGPEVGKIMQPLMGTMITQLDALAESLTKLEGHEEDEL